MTDEQLHHILYSFRFQKSEITFLRHNENRTYKVSDADGSSYVLRIHQPFKESMTGLQHTYEGLMGELLMLESLAKESSLLVQSPLRNRDGELITVIEHEGQRLNCSVLTWLEGRDLQKEDVQKPELVRLLGSQVAKLHEFYRQYRNFALRIDPSKGLRIM
ncbi:phosphotransferase enzyme family protein [Paenibacillus sp. E194]|uniref:phosphotransferase enzyme family protein n=1 Tax=Paenibacillus sp. E194 TaxID=1458845 RepID=UPI000AA2E9CA|nr:phosphotransferase [Paenibacillus sp. E194]